MILKLHFKRLLWQSVYPSLGFLLSELLASLARCIHSSTNLDQAIFLKLADFRLKKITEERDQDRQESIFLVPEREI